MAQGLIRCISTKWVPWMLWWMWWVCALVCWLLLSREVLPRLGPAVAGSRAALWTAGLVLLAAWMPFDNGLRPEGQITTGALITYVLIERAISSGRLTPAALAIITASFTLGIQPTGLIAVAALLAGGRPILRILMRRKAVVGIWPLIAPLLAAGDGALDAQLLSCADASIRPSHGELHALGWQCERTAVTTSAGAHAAEEILRWLAERAGASLV